MAIEDLLFYVRSAEASLLLDARAPSVHRVIHWGPDLGDLPNRELAELSAVCTPAVAWSTIDRPAPRSVLRQHTDGHFGRPNIAGHRDGLDWSPCFVFAGWRSDDQR